MARIAIVKKSVLAIATVGALTAGVALTTGAANADAIPMGTVTANPSLTVREAPSRSAASTGALQKGDQVRIYCKTTGTSIMGNTTWYALSLGAGSGGYVSARYVKASGSVETCGGPTEYGRATTDVNLRQGPSTKDKVVGGVSSGSKFKLICKVTSQKVSGNSTWYWTSTHRWVSARYVSNVGAAPIPCR